MPDGAAASRNPAEAARGICLRLLAAAPRTRAQLADALRRRGVPQAAIEEVLGRLGEVGLIDDRAFAEAWVSSRHLGRGLGRRALAAELRARGVDGETVSDAVGALDPADEESTARALVERRLRATRGLAPDARIRRLSGLLARRGYAAGLTRRVVLEALAAEGRASDGSDPAAPDDPGAPDAPDAPDVTDLDGWADEVG